MITKVVKTTESANKYYAAVELYGLSTDSKPTDEQNGTLFLEMNTGKVFVYDAQNTTWFEL